mgnify:CR=1 FL=1
MGKRPYTPWEIMMISEWVAKTFPDARWQTNVRLGKIQPRLPDGTYTEDEARGLGLWRRRVDAIVYLRDRLLLVEAILRADPGKISILKLYEMLVPQTPELVEFRDLPIQKVLLYCIEDPVLNVLAEKEGILPIQYVPSFFDRWFSKLAGRKKRTPRSDFLEGT